MKHILKSLIAHSSQSIALFVEIVIVTIIGWLAIEPVAVKTSLSLIPAGYDYEKLVNVKFANFDHQSEDYDSITNVTESKQRLLGMIRELPEIELATFSAYCCFESGSVSSYSLSVDSAYNISNEDDRYIGAMIVDYIPDTDFFKTFGIKASTGEDFDEPENDGNSFIVTNTLARARYAVKSAIGQNLFDYDEEDGDEPTPITGVLQDMPYRKSNGRTPVMFRALTPEHIGWYAEGIAMRLKDGVNPRVFADKLTTELSNFRNGNTYLSHVQLYTDMRDEIFADDGRELTKGWIILIFFLANVILGVAGTFYIQCRARTADAGVMRAFGATRGKVEWNIIGEAILTVVFAWAVGSILYLAYLHFAHVEFGHEVGLMTRMLNPMWFDSAWSRNCIVGGLVLLLLLLSTLLGVWLPARKIGRVNPVDALRDE